jgi:hypothetical protein
MTKDRRFSPILLQRKSVLSVYSSLLIAKKTREWVQLRRDQKPDQAQEQVRFDKVEFENFRRAYVGRFLQAEANMRQHGVEYLKVYYEDLIAGTAEMGRVFDFLGLDRVAERASILAVQNSPDVLSRFTNPDAAMPFYKQERAEIEGRLPARGRLVLHLGPPKTGTTALQIGLQKLRQAKFAYVGTLQSRSRNAPQGIHARLGKATRADMPDDFLARLLFLIDVRLKAGTDLMLSEEMLLVDQPIATFQEKLERLGQICGAFQPRIVLTPREPVSALKSLYNELYIRQAMQPHKDFAAFLDSGQARVYDYPYVLDLLRKAGFADIRGVQIERGKERVPLSDITGIGAHSSEVELALANETAPEEKALIATLEVPEEMAARLTDGYHAVMAELGLAYSVSRLT